MHLKSETIVGVFILAAVALFVYISFQIGSIRLDLARYAHYTVRFKDVAGLVQRGDIKIAGVKVGWIESLRLQPEDMKVCLSLNIMKEYPLYNDAQALVRQEGLLGAKFLEIIPGTKEAGRIKDGGTLAYQSRQFIGMDDLFYAFQKIVDHVETVSTSFKNMSEEAQALLRSIHKRLEPIDALLQQLMQSTQTSTHTFQETADAVSQVASNVGELLHQMKVPVRQVGDLAQKLTAGEGSLGKLLTDANLYEDIQSTAQYAKCCIEKVRGIGFGIDSHLEVLPRCKTNVKWYCDGRFYPCSSFFGQLGFVYSHEGFAKKFIECDDRKFIAGMKERRDGFRLNLELGCHFLNRWTLRAGIIEGTAGIACDYYDPWGWVSTFEAFDFRGHNRFDLCDRRPHLKWLNRIYFTPEFYLVAGADDFISRSYKSAIIGCGVTFSSCDWFR